jgi:SAM-dependent methyltransferase
MYERHPYPPPVDDLDRYRERWDNRRRRADSHLFWPDEPYREDRSVLVAGCGTSQAAKHAMRWPRAQVIGIDVSTTSIEKTAALKRKYSIDNLEVRELPVERATELGRRFAHVVCTGALRVLARTTALGRWHILEQCPCATSLHQRSDDFLGAAPALQNIIKHLADFGRGAHLRANPCQRPAEGHSAARTGAGRRPVPP